MLSPQEPTSEAPRDESRAALERRVLRALCQGTGQGSVKALARSVLAGYRWRDPVHAVVFDLVMSFPVSDAAAVKEHLPARLTRRGFPDFDLAALFSSPQPTHEEAATWIQRLRQFPEDDG
jgi:hypothetical protein